MQTFINILIDFGILGIAIAGFFEAIFLPMPMEIVFIPVALLNTSKALIYSITIIIFSTLGSVVGYYLGKFLGTPLLNKIISKDKYSKLKKMYTKNAFLTILTSCFTPIPYEAYVISAGAFNINLTLFITASIISRFIRYLPQGILISMYGGALLSYMKSYSIYLGLLIFILALFFKYLSIKKT